jgi:hypothetical protein
MADSNPSNLARFAAAAVERLQREDPELYAILDNEYRRQANVLSMVASSSIADPSALICEATPFHPKVLDSPMAKMRKVPGSLGTSKSRPRKPYGLTRTLDGPGFVMDVRDQCRPKVGVGAVEAARAPRHVARVHLEQAASGFAQQEQHDEWNRDEQRGLPLRRLDSSCLAAHHASASSGRRKNTAPPRPSPDPGTATIVARAGCGSRPGTGQSPGGG